MTRPGHRTGALRGLFVRDALRGCDSVGHDVVTEGRIHVNNLGRITIADAVQFRSRVAPSHLATGERGTLTIGEGARIGQGAAIAAHDSVDIGVGAEIGPFVLIMDTDFHEAGRHDDRGATAPIRIGTSAILGARVTVLRGTSIGDGAVVAAGSVVKGLVPPGAYVAGNPAVAPPESGSMQLSPLSWEVVSDTLRYALGLATTPSATVHRQDVEQWDSLGGLNVLIALERRFGVDLPAESVASVRTLGDIMPLLREAEARRTR